MPHVDSNRELIGRRARLIFRTTHIDRAGETSSTRTIEAEVVELDANGVAILVSIDGIHLQFPAAQLQRDDETDSITGGQELTRDFHNAIEPVRMRWLTGEDLNSTS